MENSYEEWWVEEITQKFNSLMRLLQLFSVACLVTKLTMILLKPPTVNLVSQFLIIFVGIFFSMLASLIQFRSPYLKITYALVLTEILNYFNLHIVASLLPEHEVIFLLASTIILVCVQLSFIYSFPWTFILLAKFEYQWYFSKYWSGKLAPPPVSTPFAAAAGAIVFYCYYRYFQKHYSYDLFCSKKELAKAEAKAQVLLKLIADGFMVIDEQETVLLANENISEYFNAPGEHILDRLEGVKYFEGQKMNCLTEGMELLPDIRMAFRTPENTESTLGITKIGNLHLEWRVKKILWANQMVLLVICRDVNQLLELQRSHAENRVKQTLLQSVAHDLQTPAQAIKAFGKKILGERDIDEAIRTTLQSIILSSRILLYLIQDILDYSKIVSGVFRINKRACSIHQIVSECTEIISCHIDSTAVTLTTRIDDQLPKSIYTDPLRLQQILMNLLSNASKFTEIGTIEICAFLSVHNTLKIQVRDTGRGISSENRRNLFTLFKTTYDPVRNQRGSGIGLNVANILAQELGGKCIKVKSIEGQGSTFSFVVHISDEFHPVSSSDSEGSEELAEDIGRIHIENFDTSSQHSDPSHILIVDDTKFILDALSFKLASNNMPHLCAGTGKEAVQHILRKDSTNHFIKVVLMDVNMEPIDGLETTRWIIELFEAHKLQNLPIVIGCTADSSEETREKCQQAGMFSVIDKGISQSRLIDIIQPFLC